MLYRSAEALMPDRHRKTGERKMRKQLIDLRRKMDERGIDAYIVPTTDFHGSEYVNDYFKCREYISGFTGSAGTLVVTAEDAGLWTDGRYFLQASQELEGSGIRLMKMNHDGTPTIHEYLKENIPTGGTVGFDGRVVEYSTGRRLAEDYAIAYDLDLAGEIWTQRPKLRGSKIYALPAETTGETAESKLARLRRAMAGKQADFHLITSLEEIAWLYNLRGNDVKYTPVFYAFALITMDEDRLYVLDQSFEAKNAMPYLKIFDDLKSLGPGKILLDENVASYSLVKSISSETKIISGKDPAEIMKATKNPAEISCTKKAHIKDGIAMVRFLRWLKTSVGKEKITEISAADRLEALRRQQAGCFDLSFETISGYMDNGAIVHYAPSPETDRQIKPEGLLLVDSGGQYEEGTTDITRTIVLGPLTDEMKEDYTTVLKSNIDLAMTEFSHGTTGSMLDEIARKPLRERGMDFDHGTGHGVGHILSVHEGPNNISPRNGGWAITPGMITTDEPGVYKEGKYGIRLENELLCVEKANGDLGFEPITLCPFDREAIIPHMLTEEERKYLNEYHKKVRDILTPVLEQEAAEWLKEQTAPI